MFQFDRDYIRDVFCRQRSNKKIISLISIKLDLCCFFLLKYLCKNKNSVFNIPFICSNKNRFKIILKKKPLKLLRLIKAQIIYSHKLTEVKVLYHLFFRDSIKIFSLQSSKLCCQILNIFIIAKRYQLKSLFIRNILLVLKIKKIGYSKHLIFIDFLAFHNFLIILDLDKNFNCLTNYTSINYFIFFSNIYLCQQVV